VILTLLVDIDIADMGDGATIFIIEDMVDVWPLPFRKAPRHLH